MRQRHAPSIEQIFLGVILAVALVARFRYLLQIEHNIDHAYTVWQALRTLDRGIFPLTGQYTSVLFDNPPMTGYLLVPVVALTRSPVGVYVFIVGLNWLGVWLAYHAARMLVGMRPALAAAGLMAVNPWVIEYSRTSWVQGLLPFFACAVAWLLWPVLMGDSTRPVRRTALALAVMAIMAHTYLLAFFIVAPVGVLLLIFRARVPLRGVLIGGSVFLLFAAPYGAGLLSKWDTLQQQADRFSSGTAQIRPDALNHAVRLVTGTRYEVARRRDAPEADFNRRHTLTTAAHGALVGVMVIGAGAMLWTLARKPRTRQQDAAVIALVWVGLPVVAMSYTTNPVHPTYQLLGLPAGYVLAAWGLNRVFRLERGRRGAVALALFGVAFAALMLTNSARHYQSIKANPGAWNLGVMPVEYGMKVGAAVNAHLPPGGVVFVDMPEYMLASFAGRLIPIINDTRVPAFHTLPARGGLYLSAGHIAPPVPLGASRVEVIDYPKDKVITVDLFPPAANATLPGNPVESPSRQGLTLIRYALTPGDEPGTWTLMTAWRVDFIAPEVYERIYGPFLHVHDATGQPVLNIGGEGLPGYRWSVGDVLVFQMPFTLPNDTSGPYTLKTGQYDGLHNANVMFILPEGENAVITLPETLP